MTSLTGTLALIRFILRRDRVRIVVWIGSIVVLAALTVAGIKGLFPTEAALDQTASATQHNAAAIALYRKFGFVEEGRRVKHYRRASGELFGQRSAVEERIG